MPAATRSLLITCVLLVGCGGAARPTGALDRIRARGELTWGADEQGGEPYVFEDAARGGALVGFEVDLADTLARALGVRARFVQNDW
jgi:polar amino acid transport system substrate-binding protein